ncbi:MAG TPA: ABC transporter ATP-binding protein [Desulfobacterales bacterium]|nr:ABC transporter ATP-binding protein [Desulfobacterales bacterium]
MTTSGEGEATGPGPVIIRFQEVTKVYRGELFKKESVALRGVSLEVQEGEIFGIIGRNGAGKSTSIKILMGFVKHSGGRVSLSGREPYEAKCHMGLGYLPESPCLYQHLTITDHLKFAAAIANIPNSEIKPRIAQILQRVGLGQAAGVKIKKFSKGMTQRAALAYALLHDPDLLILDEPMSGLDPFGRQMVIDIINDYRERNKTVLFCSHILTDVERICDRIGVMNRGRIIKIMRPEEIPPTTGRHSKSPLEAMFIDLVNSDTGADG